MVMRYFLLAFMFVVALVGCGEGGGGNAALLNDKAYGLRYVSLDSCEAYALRASELPDAGDDERHLSMLNRAFVRYMRLDLAGAVDLCLRVLDESDNGLVCLLADVDLMRISALTSANKDFFFYRNDATKRMEGIRRGDVVMDARQKRYYGLALGEFHIVSSEYYYGLRQEREALREMEALESVMEDVDADSVQKSALMLLRSVSDLLLGGNDGDGVNFRNVVSAYRMSRDCGAAYQCARALQLLAHELVRADSIESYRLENIKGLVDKKSVSNDSLPLVLGNESLDMAGRYGCRYLESLSLLSLSDYFFYDGCYDEALAYVERVLEIINGYHSQYVKDGKTLALYSNVTDSVSAEMLWISDTDVPAIPNWIAEVRERLSMIYGAMGMKQASDYNRNIYLDILDATRQDMSMEQRLDSLDSEERMLDTSLLMCGCVVVLLFALLSLFVYRQKRRNAEQAERLLEVIGDCRTFLSQSMSEGCVVDDGVNRRLLGVVEPELKSVIDVFTDWVEHNKGISKHLDDTLMRMEDESFMSERRMEDKKRDNISKLVSMSIVNGILPFLDRAIRVVDRLKADGGDLDVEKCRGELEYLSELIDKINVYNDVMARWVMMRKGIVTLNVETFELQPMFDVLSKNRSLYEAKGVVLDVEPTPLAVKADKALTFFMVSTLMDNARKYTQSGGRVLLKAEATDDEGVRISVVDTGRGLSESDVNTILNEKVYDSSQIGNPDADADLRKNKGFGFGLMSCKGIIDKYRKISSAFSVCRFGVESVKGQGSTFSFVLPKGVQRVLHALLLLFSLSFPQVSCSDEDSLLLSDKEYAMHKSEGDAVLSDTLVSLASYYADRAFYSNVQGEYSHALEYADSAICELNRFHQKIGVPEEEMRLLGTGMPEVSMYEHGANTDYHIILDIRNEAAIASLALNLWDTYHYNNEIYTRLYKVMAQDAGLEDYCNAIERNNANKQTLLVFVIILVVSVLLVIFLMYYKNTLLPALNMRQLLWMNRKVYGDVNLYGGSTASDSPVAGNPGRASEYYASYVDTLYECVSGIKAADGVALYVADSSGGDGIFVCTHDCPDPDYMRDMMLATSKRAEVVVKSNGRLRFYPLLTEEGAHPVGTIGIAFRSDTYTTNDDIVFRLMAQFTALNIYYSDMMIKMRLNDIEALEDKKRRVNYEENMIHVQNQILDNCLSTIKHETMYYPNRIKQIVDNVKKRSCVDAGEVDKMHEVISCYKEIFSILHRYASRQLGATMFKRRKISAGDMCAQAQVMFARQRERHAVDLQLDISGNTVDANIVGDEHLTKYLMSTLLVMSFDDKSPGRLSLGFEISDGFVKFAFTDSRGSYTVEQLDSLFYPDALVSADDTVVSRAKHMLVCRQIVREHDEHSGRRGCRIYALPNEGTTGYRLTFTLPAT